jgi:hypothetical protein
MPDGIIGQVIAIGLFMVGVVLVLSAEYGWNYLMADGRIALDEAERLRGENAEVRANREELARELKLRRQQSELYRQELAKVRKELAVSQAQYEVFRSFDAGEA